MQTYYRFIHAICARCTCLPNVQNLFEYAIDTTLNRERYQSPTPIECHTHTCTVHAVYTSICCYLCSRSVRLYRLIRSVYTTYSSRFPSLSSSTSALSLAPLAVCCYCFFFLFSSLSIHIRFLRCIFIFVS